LLVPLAKLRDFTQAIFDPADEVVPVGLGGVQFILVSLLDLGCPLCHLDVEARPYALLVVIVLLREQSERFLGGKLCNASEVPYSKAIQNLSALQFPRAATQRALDGVIYFAALPHV
jgi:hypothetical protein